MPFEVDVLVVGGGPAGLAAASEAATRGAEVVLVDERRGPGGGLAVLGGVPAGHSGRRAASDLHRTLRDEADAAGVSVLTESVGWALFGGTRAGVVTPGENLEIRAAAVVIASGASDRLMPFPGWTLPTVMGALDALRLVYLDDAPPGGRPAVYSAGGLGVPVALALRDAGLDVAALLEAGALTAAERAALTARGIPTQEDAVLRAARGTEYVESVAIEAPGGRASELACDALVLAVGRAPLAELCWIAGCATEWVPEAGGFVPTRGEKLETSIPSVFVAGAAGGICGLDTAVAEGRLAGAGAAAAAGHGAPAGIGALVAAVRQARTQHGAAVRRETEAVWRLESEAVRRALGDPEAVLCRCEYVTVRQIRDATAAGARTPGEVKRLTRAAMGECQGRACRPLLSRAVSQLLDRPLEAVRPVTFRPPVRPMLLETLLRRTP